MDNKYIVDANIFITAHRQIYPFDVVPSFWEQLIEKSAHKIIILEEVQNEILRGNDKLAEWYNEESSNFIVARIPGQAVIEAYREIINSVNNNGQYRQSAKDEFASIADSWLCAYGLAYEGTIVTLETYQEGVKNRIKIPNVCRDFNIKYINLLEFMREIGMKL